MIDRACISITEKCNLGCSYCHFSQNGREKEDILWDDAISVIHNISDYIGMNAIETFKLGIVGGGEPTLRMDLLKEIIRMTKRVPALKPYVISNGFRICDSTLKFFYENREHVSLSFSLDGPKMLHDSNRLTLSGNPTYGMVSGTIDRYVALFGDVPLINCTVTSDHILHQDELIEYFVQKRFLNVTFSLLFDSHHSPSEFVFRKFLQKASNRLNLRQMRKTSSYDCRKYGSLCGVGRTNIFFTSDGVYPCARLSGSNDFKLGEVSDPLDVIECNLKRIKQVDDGECFYDVHYGGTSS